MGEEGSASRELVSRIETMRGSGASPEQVYTALLGEGHLVVDVERAFRVAEHPGTSQDMQQRVVRILLVVGAILVGAGAFSFVAANWRAMVPATRVAVILVAMTGFSALGWYLKERRGYRWTGEALLLLGSIVYGAGIFLMAQIFNVHANWPDGLFLWLIGALAMAAATRSNLLYALGLLVGLAGVIAYPIELFAGGAFDPYLLTSPVLAAVAAGVALVAGVTLRRGHPDGALDRW